MKTYKRTIVTVVIIFCYSFCYAQRVSLTPSQWLESHKKSINSVTYIFEGTVIKQKCYYGKRLPGQVLTCSVIQITKIFKGNPQLKFGTIKVITEGGHIPGTNYVSPPDDGGSISISKGGHYIIFGVPVPYAGTPNFSADRQPLDSNALKSIVTNNIGMFNLGDVIWFKSEDTIQWWEDTQFKTKEDVYSFFKENGLTVQEEQK